MKPSEYLRTSEQEEAVRSLEWAATQAKLIEGDPYLWKWLIISLHNASQGFMVLALWNGNSLLSMPNKVAEKWLKAHQNGTQYPEARLDKFLDLYRKSKDPANFNYLGSTPFSGSSQHDASFEYLNEFRNEFIHFSPKGWSLRLHGLPEMTLDVLALIEHFGWRSTSILWYEPGRRTRAKWAHRSLVRTMKKMRHLI